ncbi:hypothetical protein HAX54_010375, partial [Datura stramonium]|nr:hypothetical protein [Datura stramonium]
MSLILLMIGCVCVCIDVWISCECECCIEVHHEKGEGAKGPAIRFGGLMTRFLREQQ